MAPFWGGGPRPFKDRHQAGEQLGALLAANRAWSAEQPSSQGGEGQGWGGGRRDVLVLAVPRGGVPVAFEVARALAALLDVIVVRKLGLPGQPELAMGAIASGGVRVLNPDGVKGLGVPDRIIEAVAARENAELERRELAFRGDRPAIDPAGRTVILVDDGLATGSSMRAGIAALRLRGAASVVVAVPVGPASTCHEIAAVADGLVCPNRPEFFMAVGEWYENFKKTTDDEVRRLIEQSASFAAPAPAPPTETDY